MQELVGHEDRLVEVAARVAAQVEDQPVDPLGTQLRQGLQQLLVGRPRELSQLDVARRAADAEGRLDAADRNDAAHDLHLDQIGDVLPPEAQPHGRSARSAQPLDDLVLRNAAARHERVVDLDDAVPGLDAGLVARSLRDDVEHDDRIGGHVEDHADAVELPFEGFVQRLHLRGGDIDRMGVKLLDQQRNDMLGERVHRHGVDVLVLDERKRIGQFVRRQRQTADHALELRRRAVAAQILSQQQAGDHARGQQQGKKHRVFGISVHHLFLKVYENPTLSSVRVCTSTFCARL